MASCNIKESAAKSYAVGQLENVPLYNTWNSRFVKYALAVALSSLYEQNLLKPFLSSAIHTGQLIWKHVAS